MSDNPEKPTYFPELVSAREVIEAETAALTDMQIATAKKYPRYRYTVRETIDHKLLLKGTMDLVCRNDIGEYAIIDYKSGWLDTDYTNQLKGYALLARQAFSTGDKSVHIITMRLRQNLLDIIKVTPDDMDIFSQALWRVVYEKPAPAMPGDFCAYCPGAGSCRPVINAIKKTKIFWGGHSKRLAKAQSSTLTPATISNTYIKIQLAEKLLEELKKQIKTILEREGGSITLEDGSVLKIEEEQRESVLLAKALPLVAEALPSGHTEQDLINALGACCHFSQPKFNKLLRGMYAEKEDVKKRMELFKEALTKNDALDVKTIRKMVRRSAVGAQFAEETEGQEE